MKRKSNFTFAMWLRGTVNFTMGVPSMSVAGMPSSSMTNSGLSRSKLRPMHSPK